MVTVTGPGTAAVQPGGSTLSDTVVSLTAGGVSYAIPVDALPYFGHGLSPALFDTGSLPAREKSGRLPVRLSYRGQAPAVPGITITSSGGGTAEGYLTSASARAFGSALARQYLADRGHAAFGIGGLFGGGTSVGVPGLRIPVPSATPHYALHTVTVRGSTLSGQPDTGDTAYLINVDNAQITGNPQTNGSAFYHGVAKFSVPAGHYFAIAIYTDLSASGAVTADRMVTIPQFTVSGDMSVRLDEHAADSEVRMATPRPAGPVATSFVIWRGDATGFQVGFGSYAPAPVTTWITPSGDPVSTGNLQTMVNAWLTSPVAGTAPYEYDLAYHTTNGTIPAGEHVVDPAGLATIDARLFSAEPVSANLAREGWFPSQIKSFPPLITNSNLFEPFIPVSLPQDRIEYTSAGPSLAWTSLLTPSGPGGGPSLQGDTFRTYPAGQQAAEDWNDYPLHPGVNVNLIGGGFGGLATTFPSASRSGDQLAVQVVPFSDNTRGHSGDFTQTGVAGSYEVDQNGAKIDGGTFTQGFFGAFETLSPDPSTVTFSLDASRPGSADPLSTQTRTVWTWRSSHQAGTTLPAGWYCPADGTQNCAVEPMMTMEYHVANVALDGTAPAGAQVLGITPGHLQLASAAAVTAVTAQVSFDGGATWQPATVTGSGTSYQARYSAPAGSFVTLKVTASDAAAGQISETITRAYRTSASATSAPAMLAPAALKPACPVVPAGQARCFALYAPQAAVNAALTAGQPAAPSGWGPQDVEAAYKLPASKDPHQTVAIVDAYDTPGLESYLGSYRQQYGLPSCTIAGGCLRVVNQAGHSAPLPASGVGSGWDLEATLDADMVSVACPLCRILVVEASSNADADMAASASTAARLGANVISNSYGDRETGLTQSLAASYRHPGHVIVASSGDSGFTTAIQFPANLASVTAVGGTELTQAAGSRGWSESVWNSGGNTFYGKFAPGSGCSAYVAKPAWQHDRDCAMRTIADVAAVADNVAIYDADYGGWLTVAGTSVAAPLIAGVYGLAGNAGTAAPGYPYRHTGSLFDVTSGNNGPASLGGAICDNTYLCVAGPGFDGPTGLGTPDGTGAF